MSDIELITKIPEEMYAQIIDENGIDTTPIPYKDIIKNGKPLSEIIDSLKELSKDHRHNYVGNSHEERAWRLGIEDSIDLILAESEKT